MCNASDKGSSFALPRKGADFRLVLDRENGAERINCRGYFLDFGQTCKFATDRIHPAESVSRFRPLDWNVTAVRRMPAG